MNINYMEQMSGRRVKRTSRTMRWKGAGLGRDGKERTEVVCHKKGRGFVERHGEGGRRGESWVNFLQSRFDANTKAGLWGMAWGRGP